MDTIPEGSEFIQDVYVDTHDDARLLYRFADELRRRMEGQPFRVLVGIILEPIVTVKEKR